MATLLGDYFGKRRPGFAGRLMVDQVRGVTRVRAWPKKRGKPKSALQQQWVDWFKGANYLAKYASSYDIIRSQELSKGTGRYPRDILLMAMRGRLFWWTLPGEGKWFPVAAIADVSDTLDILAQELGNILVRAGDRWRALADKDEGDVLTHHPGALPTWEEPAGAGGGAFAGALLTRTTGLPITHQVWKTMIWQTEQYDTDAFFDPVASSTRVTIPAGFSFCRLTANINWQAASPGYRHLLLWKNGAPAPGTGLVTHNPTGFGSQQNMSSAVMPCVEGDYFECRVFHNRGTTLSVLAAPEGSWFNLQAFP